MVCCDVNIDLGCVPSCGVLLFPYPATESGTHTITVNHGSNYKTFTITGTIGVNFSIDLSNFNETGLSYFQIKNPSGTTFTTEVSDVDYSCFKLKTSVVYGSTSTTSTSDDECCESTLIAVVGESSYTVTASQWAAFGSVPSFEVIMKIDGLWITNPVQPVYDTMPNPTTALIDIGGIPADPWYIKIKS